MNIINKFSFLLLTFSVSYGALENALKTPGAQDQLLFDGLTSTDQDTVLLDQNSDDKKPYLPAGPDYDSVAVKEGVDTDSDQFSSNAQPEVSYILVSPEMLSGSSNSFDGSSLSKVLDPITKNPDLSVALMAGLSAKYFPCSSLGVELCMSYIYLKYCPTFALFYASTLLAPSVLSALATNPLYMVCTFISVFGAKIIDENLDKIKDFFLKLKNKYICRDKNC